MIIRDIKSDDFDQWNALWQGYLTFYKTTLTDDITKATWDRFFDDKSPISCHVAEEGGSLLGFSISVVHPSTWAKQESCYLEDLFVSEAARSKGVGQKLIENLQSLAVQKGWARVYWHTDTDNVTARKLYDKFKPADDVVRYKLDVA